MGPSLDELQYYGYLAGYRIEVTSDGRDYKIVADHGTKFFKDQKTRAALPMPEPTRRPPIRRPRLKELVSRGLSEGHARRLLQSLPEGQCVLDQLEYGDWVIAKSRKAIVNPPGFYIYLLRENVMPPNTFESSSKRLAKAAIEETKNDEKRNRLQLEHEYKQFCEERVTIYVETEMDRGEYEERLKQKMQEVKVSWPRLPRRVFKKSPAGLCAPICIPPWRCPDLRNSAGGTGRCRSSSRRRARTESVGSDRTSKKTRLRSVWSRSALCYHEELMKGVVLAGGPAAGCFP